MKGRFKLGEVIPVTRKIEHVLSSAGIISLTCGSVRRKKEIIGDIDIVVQGKMENVIKVLKPLTESTVSGDAKVQHIVVNGIGIDVYTASKKEWGAMVLTLTGSKDFNIRMRERAKRKGWLLNQYGLWSRRKDGIILASESEEDICEKLGMKCPPPEYRG